MTAAYDAIVIGTGQAGPSLAARLAKPGLKGAIVERKLFGGTCVNTGCIPTKAMVASASAAHMVRRAAEFGVDAGGGSSVDMRRVKARKDAISGKSRTTVEAWLKNMDNCTVYEGHARFESPQEVSVGPHRLTAKRIFINVGGRAVVPQMPGLDQVEYLTNSSMMNVDFHHGTVGEVLDLIQSGHLRHHRAPAHVDEDPLGGEPVRSDAYLLGRLEASVALIDGAVVHVLQPCLNRCPGFPRYGILPGFHPPHIDARASAGIHPELGCAANHMGGVSAGDHGLGRNAACVDTGAAEQLALDDGDL